MVEFCAHCVGHMCVLGAPYLARASEANRWQSYPELRGCRALWPYRFLLTALCHKIGTKKIETHPWICSGGVPCLVLPLRLIMKPVCRFCQ